MTANPPDEPVPGRMRVSDAERDAVVERLQDAAAEGRIDLDELETRLDAALTAKTYADLAPLTADLPRVVPPAPVPPLVVDGGLQGASRTGRWPVPSHIAVNGGMAGVKLDFTRTECRLPEIEIEAHGQLAGVTLVLPEAWAVDTAGFKPGYSGGLTDKTNPERRAGTPLVRLTGTGGAAGVVVRHPNRLERRKLERDPP